MYATANGFATLASNKDTVRAFFKGTRFLYKGWAHGYRRAVAVTSREMVSAAACGAKGVLGPSVIYGCTMRLASACGLPSLIAVGGANVATPLLVSKLGGPLRAMPLLSLAARASPIAAHCAVEWGLFQRFKERLKEVRPEMRTKPKTRMRAVLDGAATGALCAAAATATTVLALSPLYGGKLLRRAATCRDPANAARLSMAAVRVTRLRLADSLQQGVVWFSTYEGMRAAMSIYDEKRIEKDWVENLRKPGGFAVAARRRAEASEASEASESSESDAGLDAGRFLTSAAASQEHDACAEDWEMPVSDANARALVLSSRFTRRRVGGMRSGDVPGAVSVWRRRGCSGSDARLSPRRKLLSAAAA